MHVELNRADNNIIPIKTTHFCGPNCKLFFGIFPGGVRWSVVWVVL